MQLLDLVEIRNYVRSEFNQIDTDGFVSEDEIDRWANEGYYKYVNKLIEASQGWFERAISLDIVGGTATVALPSNFASNPSHHASIRLEKVLSGGNMPLEFRRRNTGEYNPNDGIFWRLLSSHV